MGVLFNNPIIDNVLLYQEEETNPPELTTLLRDADTLAGHPASYFLPREEYTPPSTEDTGGSAFSRLVKNTSTTAWVQNGDTYEYTVTCADIESVNDTVLVVPADSTSAQKITDYVTDQCATQVGSFKISASQPLAPITFSFIVFKCAEVIEN